MRLRPLMLAVSLIAAMTATLLTTAAPAQAATADRWGFAYVDDPTVPFWTTLDVSHQWGSWKTAAPLAWATGGKVAPGRFQVRFPSVSATSNLRSNVHVTPVNRTGHYCVIVRWLVSAVDVIVDVQCFKPGGIPDDTKFTVLWTQSSGVVPAATSYASVQYGAFGVVQSYNSTGAAVTVAAGPIGQYNVRFSGVAPAGVISGNVQVSAVHPNAGPRRCKVSNIAVSGTDIVALVFCYDAGGLFVNSEFTASYHRQRSVYASANPPTDFGYVWTGGGGQTNYNNAIPAFGINTVSPLLPSGRYLVDYPQLGTKETHAQVTAYGTPNTYCHLTQLWAHVGADAEVDVMCFNPAGTPTTSLFMSTFSSRF